jgi:hypothetical protein
MEKKRQPVPDRCPCCGRLPVISKVKPGRWTVDCPGANCKGLNYAVGATEKEAIEKWNEEVRKK